MKQSVKLQDLPQLINALAKTDITITRCVKNGNDNVVLEYKV